MVYPAGIYLSPVLEAASQPSGCQHRQKRVRALPGFPASAFSHDWKVASMLESPFPERPVPSVNPTLTISSKHNCLPKAFTSKYYHSKWVKQNTIYSIITSILYAYDNTAQSCYSYTIWVKCFCIVNVLMNKFLKLVFKNCTVWEMLLSQDASNIW